MTATDHASAATDAIRNANRVEYERRAAEATDKQRRRVEAYERGELDDDRWIKMLGPPRMRVTEPTELAERDAKETASVCPRCFAPLDVVHFISYNGGRRGSPMCRDCFEKSQAYYGDHFWKHRDRDGWWGTIVPETVFSACCAGCDREMVFGYWHMHVHACSTRCDKLAVLGRRRQRRAEARAGITCEECGQQFDPPRADAKTCSPACRQKAYRRRSVTDDDTRRSRPPASRNGGAG